MTIFETHNTLGKLGSNVIRFPMQIIYITPLMCHSYVTVNLTQRNSIKYF